MVGGKESKAEKEDEVALTGQELDGGGANATTHQSRLYLAGINA